MSNIEKITDYLEKAKVFYFATADGNKPKCRPISFKMEYNGKLYFGVGTFKAVYRQLQKNPRIEVCASDGQGFLRYYGEVKFDSDPVLFEKALEVMPELSNIYNKDTGYQLGMFYLENATAEWHNMLGIEESISV